METITEDYVSFEAAKLLKEKGFDVPCLAHWFIGTDIHFSVGTIPQNWNEVKTDLDWLSCPTHQMAMKWVRIKYNIIIIIALDLYKFDDGEIKFYIEYYNLKKPQESCAYEGEHIYFDSYEQACEEAIKYCLEKLI